MLSVEYGMRKRTMLIVECKIYRMEYGVLNLECAGFIGKCGTFKYSMWRMECEKTNVHIGMLSVEFGV